MPSALKETIALRLQAFSEQPIAKASLHLLNALGYASKKTADFGHDAETFLSCIEQFRPELGEIKRNKVKADCWNSCAFLFQISNDEIPSLAVGQPPLGADRTLASGQIESFVFLAIELQAEHWSRTDLAAISRELNRRFPMPAIIIFSHGGLLSLAVIDRRQHLKESSRDVIDSRITVIKDVRLSNPHRAHLDILANLALENLGDKRRPSSFRELYDAWIDTLSTQKLNETFYKQLAWWYLWAIKEVRFPQGGGADRDAIGVIRLLTRLIFVWFIKERGLIPEALFDRKALKSVLKVSPGDTADESHYYHAILQNLFFATLNVDMGAERRWAKEGSGMKGDYLISLVYRHKEAFQNPDAALADHFANVPFLNGGLFECLDEALTDHDFERHPALRDLAVKEGSAWVLRIDGFSRRPEARAHVPNKLFFGGTDDAALNTEFETKGKRYPVKGLIDLLNGYKFTIDENTPLDEEVALDPELLGKVFENLLASYNPDTRSTARKQSGSFYTPREVVDYMVDEALITYFARCLLIPSPTEIAPAGGNVALAGSKTALTPAPLPLAGEGDGNVLLAGEGGNVALAGEGGRSAFPPSPASGRGAGGEGHRTADITNPTPLITGAKIGARIKIAGEVPLPTPPDRLPDDIRDFARQLRAEQTDAEHFLWRILRNRRFLDLKFRRQHPENRYILDFYCDELKLAIELDGGQHAEQADYDEARSAFLAERGICVLRFWNNQMLGESEAVLEAVYQAVMALKSGLISAQSALTPTPLPLAGEGNNTAQAHEARLRCLLSHGDTEHDFNEEEARTLVSAIENLKVLDPACGSGAFPMGILSKLFVALKKLDPDNQRWRKQNLAPLQKRLTDAYQTPDPVQRDAEISEAEAALEKHQKDFADPSYADYTRKLYLIEKCIFGSDIQPIAVQIAKLRFFIALIVSQPIDRNKPNWNITPLPNLETKIVAANTLFGVPRHGTQGSLLDNPLIAEKEGELRDANAAYFSSRTRATKKRRKEKVQTLHEALAILLKHDGFVTADDAERMARWDPFDQNRYADFFDVEWMFGMPRARDNSEAVFDIVIGNPPYVRHEEIKALKPFLKDIYKYQCYTGTADLFVYFYERAVKLLKPHGVLSFISSNKWYRAKYGADLRQFMATKTALKSIIDFGDEAVFTALAYPTILIATKHPPLPPAGEGPGVRAPEECSGGNAGNAGPKHTDQAPPRTPEPHQVRVLNWQQTHPVTEFPAVFQSHAFDVPQAELKKEAWQLEPPLKRALLTRLRLAGQPLGEYVHGRFYRGILTGLNEAFVIDGATRARLIAEDPKSAAVIKPFLRGRDVKRWGVEPQDLWLIFTRRPFDISKYPAIHKHLAAFRERLEPKPEHWNDKKNGTWPGRKAGSYQWFEIQDNIAYWQEFEQPKIIVPAIAPMPSFAPDFEGYFSNNKSTIFLPPKVNFALGVLNSSVNAWLATQVCSTKQGGFFDFEPRYSGQLMIPFASTTQMALLESLVSIVLALSTNPLPQAGEGCAAALGEGLRPRFEQLINGLVFELFFPEDLHRAKIHLFEACEKEGLGALANALTPNPSPACGRGEYEEALTPSRRGGYEEALTPSRRGEYEEALTPSGRGGREENPKSPSPTSGRGVGVRAVVNPLAERIFATSHPIYAMLFDLQALDVVRIIEGRE